MTPLTMLHTIATRSEAMAVDAAVDLDARVEHCPAWAVRDLIVHIGDVQWFWAEVVSNRFTDRVTIDAHPKPAMRGEPLDWFCRQTQRLVHALGDCDAETPLWTWWPPSQHAGFVLRRQMIEVAVHGWDAANAVGVSRSIDVDVATVGLAEFIEVMADDIVEGSSPMAISLEPIDSDWRGVLFADRGAPRALSLSSSDLLLALWGRHSVADPVVAQSLVAIDLS
jgi:uncharacterized protein (TIGR03083 family)